MHKTPHYVYTLAYPELMGGCVFYVGKGRGNRIDEHEREARRDVHKNTHKENIIRKIWREGGKVVKQKIGFFETHEEACLYEIALIFFMQPYGLLANLTAGGDGSMDPPEETRRRIGAASKARNTGKKFTEEHRHKISEALTGKSCTEAEFTRLRGYNEARKGKPGRPQPGKGKPLSLEHRRKISEGLKASPIVQSEEYRRKGSKASTGRSKSEATRRKLSEAGKGRIRSEEWNRNLGKAHRKRIQKMCVICGQPFECTPSRAKEQVTCLSEACRKAINHQRVSRPRSAEARLRMSEVRKGKPVV